MIIATPTTLIALLKAVAYGWQQETLEKNVITIGKLGQELFTRVSDMAEHAEDMGKSLKKAVEHYNSMIGSIETRVLVTTRKFKALGELSSDDIPRFLRLQLQPESFLKTTRGFKILLTRHNQVIVPVI